MTSPLLGDPHGGKTSAASRFDELIEKITPVLLPVARACLLSTYFEDGLRMMLQHGEQARYIKHIWHSGWYFAYAFVILNALLQIVPAAMMLFKKQVKIAFALLLFVAVLQTVFYQMFFDFGFFLRTLAVTGGLCFVLADELNQASNIFSLSFSTQVNKSSNWLQLAGRLLLVIMFLTLVRFDDMLRIAIEIVGLALVVAVAVGFQTKRCASGLVILLLIENVLLNAFWMQRLHTTKFDFKLYDFFQTMSVIGGLMMVVALGPGSVSLDKSKKSL